MQLRMSDFKTCKCISSTLSISVSEDLFDHEFFTVLLYTIKTNWVILILACESSYLSMNLRHDFRVCFINDVYDECSKTQHLNFIWFKLWTLTLVLRQEILFRRFCTNHGGIQNSLLIPWNTPELPVNGIHEVGSRVKFPAETFTLLRSCDFPDQPWKNDCFYLGLLVRLFFYRISPMYRASAFRLSIHTGAYKCDK